MFLILREPADSLATAVITYRNEGSLTRKGQQLSQEPSTSREWMLNSNNLFSARERFFKHRHHLRQRSSKALTKVQLIVETSAQSASLTVRRSQLHRNGPSLQWSRVKESLELVKSFCKVYEASCYTVNWVMKGS
jgi:hypothetical protein